MLRGSVLKFIPPSGAAFFRIVPTVGEVLTTGATPKLLVIDKIGNIAKGATVANLAADGLVDLLPGVLTAGGEAGSRAGEVTAGGLAAELNPPSAAGLITKLSVKIAGTAVEVDVEDAATMLSLSWQPWGGEPGGLSATPKGDGLDSAAAARRMTLGEAEALGPAGPASMMAATALEVLAAGRDGRWRRLADARGAGGIRRRLTVKIAL